MGRNAAPREGQRLLAMAVLLAGAHAGMIALAPALVEQDRPGAPPVMAFVGLALLGGAAWFAAIGPLERRPPGWATVGAIVILGAAMRLGWLATPLVLDTDALRYLWDGALVAHGIWPWAAPPDAGLPPGLAEAGSALHAVLPFAQYRSIYPGTAQLAFVLAHWIAPWELLGLRVIMLAAELATLALLAVLLRRSNQPVMRVAVWWLCPLLPLVLTNAAHVDALLPPLLLGVLCATLNERGWLAGGLLGLAAGVKVWPILLVPLVARWLPPGARVGAAAAFMGVAAAMLLPLAATLAAPDAGLSAYARAWVINNAPVSWVMALLGRDAGLVLRPLLALAAGAVALAVASRPPGAPVDLVRAALVVSAAVFYLSPAQYPWYAVWFLPFAALLGCQVLLLPAVLLPLYYLFFALLDEPGHRSFFANGIAAMHLLGVLFMLRWVRRRTASRP